jgi:guanylate kinase
MGGCSAPLTVGRKYSTRPRRKTDAADMRVGLFSIDPSVCDIVYSRYGHEYGLSSREIDDCLKSGSHFALVLQDIATVRLLASRYPSSRRVFVYRPLTETKFMELSKQRGTAESESEIRFGTAAQFTNDYYANLEIFTDTLLNAGSLAQLQRATRVLVSSREEYVDSDSH